MSGDRPFLLVFSLFPIGALVAGFATGRMTLGGPGMLAPDRKEDPKMFWFAAGTYVAFAAMLCWFAFTS